MAARSFAIVLSLLLIIVLTACTKRVAIMKTPIDLTHNFDEHTIYWPTETGFLHETEFFGPTDKGYFYSSFRFSSPEHGGTHIDAPIHFNENGQTLEAIPLERLIGPGVLVDITAACRNNRDYLVSIEDFIAWEALHKRSLSDTIILLKTGFADFWPDRKRYMGTDEKGAEAVKKLHFPGLDPKAARWLAEERHIRSIGIDTPSIDHGPTSTYDAHRILFEFNIPAFENIASLDRLPAFGFEVIALPMKIAKGSGGPLRIVALVPKNS